MPKRPTRLYIRTNRREYRRLAWFHNHRPNEMLLGIYGQGGRPAVLAGMWPEREVSSNDLKDLGYEWKDMVKVGTVLDHVTCHADGTFHVKTSGGALAYSQTMKRTEPLGKETSVITTGGMANLIKEQSRWIEMTDPNLTLDGLYLVARKLGMA